MFSRRAVEGKRFHVGFLAVGILAFFFDLNSCFWVCIKSHKPTICNACENYLTQGIRQIGNQCRLAIGIASNFLSFQKSCLFQRPKKQSLHFLWSSRLREITLCEQFTGRHNGTGSTFDELSAITKTCNPAMDCFF